MVEHSRSKQPGVFRCANSRRKSTECCQIFINNFAIDFGQVHFLFFGVRKRVSRAKRRCSRAKITCCGQPVSRRRQVWHLRAIIAYNGPTNSPKKRVLICGCPRSRCGRCRHFLPSGLHLNRGKLLVLRQPARLHFPQFVQTNRLRLRLF